MPDSKIALRSVVSGILFRNTNMAKLAEIENESLDNVEINKVLLKWSQ